MTPSITVAGLRNQEAGHAGLVDVRSPAEFAAGHIPGAVNIPMEQIESRLDDLNPNGPVILICQTGQRARMTAALLEPCHRLVAVLDGGAQQQSGHVPAPRLHRGDQTRRHSAAAAMRQSLARAVFR